jgi:AAA+ superfamily predicted ATPase
VSKRHTASRRRTYGRRQHELHERVDRMADVVVWAEEADLLGLNGGYQDQLLVRGGFSALRPGGLGWGGLG